MVSWQSSDGGDATAEQHRHLHWHAAAAGDWNHATLMITGAGAARPPAPSGDDEAAVVPIATRPDSVRWDGVIAKIRHRRRHGQGSSGEEEVLVAFSNWRYGEWIASWSSRLIPFPAALDAMGRSHVHAGAGGGPRLFVAPVALPTIGWLDVVLPYVHRGIDEEPRTRHLERSQYRAAAALALSLDSLLVAACCHNRMEYARVYRAQMHLAGDRDSDGGRRPTRPESTHASDEDRDSSCSLLSHLVSPQ